MGKKPSKSRIARAREYVRRNEFDIRLHALAILFTVPSPVKKKGKKHGR